MISIKYHDATKHDFNRFARSLGYLDWATQPDPFRRFAGSPPIELPRARLADAVPYEALFRGENPPAPIDASSVGEFLRCSMGLSAWKQYRDSRWALRVNPSSGNLHPTEAYVVWEECLYHYAPRTHVLERRCRFERDAWREFSGGEQGFLVALTSVHWREAWKYGERAFRYCQHDTGHAIGALRFAAALLGWKLTLLSRWSDDQLAALLGVDRAADFEDVERETPQCAAIVTPGNPSSWVGADPGPLVRTARQADWQGTPNRLSQSRVDWPIIDQVAEATRYPGRHEPLSAFANVGSRATRHATAGWQSSSQTAVAEHGGSKSGDSSDRPRREPTARDVILRRRSAVAFDGHSMLPARAFMLMLRRLRPDAPPWDAIDWSPHVHLVLFVHRVSGLAPGVYAYLREPHVLSEWQAAMRSEFLWEPIDGTEDLFLLAPVDVRLAANRLSCDQDIAADGFFSLGMLARVESSLHEYGEWLYKRLFWECGLIGQVLYLEAEAAGARGTGIGCFYDDPVHDTLGLSDHEWQALYHFSMGMAVEDSRLTTEAGYAWESPAPGAGDAIPATDSGKLA